MTAVVPVKPLALAKTRLDLAAEQRGRLALAFATDTVTSLRACPLVTHVLVVTSDPDVAAALRPLGVGLVADPGAGLRAAVAEGVRVASAAGSGADVAVVPADLPCLRADDVTWVLRAAGRGGAARGAFVPDLSGTGTTLLVLPAGSSVGTRYGPGSAAGHRRLGLRCLDGAPYRARRDVDTPADLRAALAHGVGPATAAVAASWSTLSAGHGVPGVPGVPGRVGA